MEERGRNPVPASFTRIWKAAGRIPAGRVASYGEVARAAGMPGAARFVGLVMKMNPRPYAMRNGRVFDLGGTAVPCHRVVCADGRLGGYSGGRTAKIRLLEHEGVPIAQGRVKDPSAMMKHVA